ncbi:MAG: LON peptidase substrate-binding domain-containing protein [Methylobacteriaceae bacterium]|jgi:Lon protease-like protein|nr:LON peptidase substrate-binding domain-containing protein [Methylobacteriaceae bacterium]
MTSATFRDSVPECPDVVPVIPLYGAILLPRAQIPLNVFEPRYMSLVDDVLKSDRYVGITQPLTAEESETPPQLRPIGCVGRITQFLETGDGRYLTTVTGVSRFHIIKEIDSPTLYRQCCVDYQAFVTDSVARLGEQDVDRMSVIETLKRYANATDVQFDWRAISEASNEALINALSLMSPFGSQEKQALLEAADLKTRAELFVAMMEMELAKSGARDEKILQ